MQKKSSQFSTGLILGIWIVILITTGYKFLDTLSDKDSQHFVFNASQKNPLDFQNKSLISTKRIQNTKYAMLKRFP